MNRVVSRWTYRKLYTLMFVIYKQVENFGPPRLRERDQCAYSNTTNVDHNESIQSWLLLGLKQRGFGQGRWNGFGGKVQNDDPTPKAAALRELYEESGLELGTESVEEVGRFWFTFEGSFECMEVHVFICCDWTPSVIDNDCVGWPHNTEEMHPQWFPLVNPENSSGIPESAYIPFDKMWPDDRFWLPGVLQGKMCLGWFHFVRLDSPMSSGGCDSISDSASVGPVCPYTIPSYRMEFFDLPVSSNKTGKPSNRLQSTITQLRLKDDDSLRNWMASGEKTSLNNAEVLFFEQPHRLS